MRKLHFPSVFLAAIGLLSLGAFAAPKTAMAQFTTPFDMSTERVEENLPATVSPVSPPATVSPLPTQQAAETRRRYLVPEKELRLDGEVERRAWSIYLTPEQAAAPARLHIGYRNSILVAPEASRLTVTVNGVAIFQEPISAPGEVSEQIAEIPEGTLKAGLNLIRFRADQRHRTDCSIESTYELWTVIEPERTFLSLDTKEAFRFSRLDDIRAVGVDDKGRTRFRLIVPALDQLGTAAILMRLSQSLALMGGMPNQSFTFEKFPSAPPRPGELLVFAGTPNELRPLLPTLSEAAGSSAVASFVDYPGGAATSALVLSGPRWSAIETLVDGIAKANDGVRAQRRDMLDTRRWHEVGTPYLSTEALIDFSQLGVEAEEFSGRLFRTRLTIGVPADFYANAYGEARILLDAAYTADVLPGSHIDVFVNGNIASTVPITSSGGATLRHLPIKLTLRHFKPGVNTIVIEAALLTNEDIACVPSVTGDKARFAIFGSSQLQMPKFASIARIPNLAAMAGTGFPFQLDPDPVSLLFGRIDENSLSAAATFLGKIALASHHIVPVDVRISTARVAGTNAVFVGTASEFPANVLTQLRIDPEIRNGWSSASHAGVPVAGAAPSFQDWQARTGGSFISNPFEGIRQWVKDNFDLTFATLRFAPAIDELYEPPQTATMVIVQADNPTENGTWTALISPDAASLAEGMQAFSARETWEQMQGRAATYESADKVLETVPVGKFRFMPTQQFSLGNARLIAANWLSDNVMSYALLLAAGGILLGLATGVLLTLLGRNR